MTDITATAYRRAAVIIKHHLAGDTQGVNAVLQEINDDTRPGPLLGALLGSLDAVTTQLVTEAGKAAFIELVAHLAGHIPDTPTVRAARFLHAYHERQPARLDTIAGETDDATPLIAGMLTVYTSLVPALTTDVAGAIIDTAIRAFINLEEGAE
ncbi:hypothetical protein [Candidatus Mycolicibacterium alkanivorans]|uniref:TetR family transcriptional regulator n=1 Tax=Candidatus Mycolicibacterium alkanivorans TaxID=2954114 RepID=A0ABS9YVP4_9MYCO|nr:hypothetical protein [Candidatus Mycolicibacterium alkanivorans]MCI4675290.1 hypothetical protein [Candidatus Mycolicibacterium alkanivorans]